LDRVAECIPPGETKQALKLLALLNVCAQIDAEEAAEWRRHELDAETTFSA
jgi:hypothetical protein